ncbi:MAG: carboxylesterase family protein [Deltaproteobacteria bacterium]|nr:carboxylesterase family protein [Deltaproteobacteria bacterium]
MRLARCALIAVGLLASSACDDGGVVAPVADTGPDATDADAASPDAASPDAAPGQRLREIVDTDLGALRGVRDGERLVFRGVPYAEAPVGELRWRAPVNVAGWEGTRDATVNGPVCPQLESWGAEPPQCSACTDDTCRAWCQSEDCLYLNVWTPADEVDAGLPVMVWLHGGSYIYGAGSSYDGGPLAEFGDVIVVTVNYRLGPLGVFGHDGLDDEAARCTGCGPANYGLWDQIRALEWVREHVVDFGGDPSRVTVFGESAGGASVCELLTSPLADGLVNGAIMQSGLCAYSMRPHRIADPGCPATVGPTCPSRAELDADGLWPCASVDCLGLRLEEGLACDGAADPLACMRASSARDVLAALPQSLGFDARGVVWSRYVDGTTLTSAPGLAMARGEGADVPLVLGTAADEASLFFLSRGPTVQTLAGYTDELANFGACSDELRAVYPAATDDEARDAYLSLIGDQWYGCPTRLSARAARDAGQPTFLYEWRYVPIAGRADQGDGFRLGAYHSAELPYVFGTLASPETEPGCVADAAGGFHCCDDVGRCFEAPDAELSRTVMAYWSSFAHDGIPRAPGEADWPRYERARGGHLWLDLPSESGTDLRGAACDVWEGVWSHLLGGVPYCN